MGTKYSTILVGGDVPDYGDNAPADDGSQVEANRVKYATIQTDVGNPLHEGIKDMDTKLVAHVDEGPDTETGTVTLTAADHNTVLECTGTFTLSLLNPTGNAGFQCTVKNAGSGTITVDVDGGANVDGAASVALAADEGRKFYVNNAGTAYYTTAHFVDAVLKIGSPTANNLVTQTAGGGIQDAGFLVTAYPLANIDIAGGTAATVNDNADRIPIYDDDAAANRFMTRANLLGSVLTTELGGWIFASTVTASGGTVDFTTTADFGSGFLAHAFVLKDIVLSTTAELWLRTDGDGGVSFDAGASDYAWGYVRTVGADSNSTAAPKIVIGPLAASPRINGVVRLYNPAGTQRTNVDFDLVFGGTTGSSFDKSSGFGVRLSAAAVDAVQFLASTGNIASGTITHYQIQAASRTMS